MSGRVIVFFFSYSYQRKSCFKNATTRATPRKLQGHFLTSRPSTYVQVSGSGFLHLKLSKCIHHLWCIGRGERIREGLAHPLPPMTPKKVSQLGGGRRNIFFQTGNFRRWWWWWKLCCQDKKKIPKKIMMIIKHG